MTNGYSGKIPTAAYREFERELMGQTHAVVSLVFHIRDGKLARYETDTHKTYIPENPAAEGGNEKAK
ncbi:MAG: hypothetical protein LBR23_01880 [Spirochaetaceae bacterium]|jgi:hypothetical protein|nr:hypothetical protein [Spirochaetaceae bacterium]